MLKEESREHASTREREERVLWLLFFWSVFPPLGLPRVSGLARSACSTWEVLNKFLGPSTDLYFVSVFSRLFLPCLLACHLGLLFPIQTA